MNPFSGKTPNKTPSSGSYDFLEGVFEWVFYSLPPRADNSFMRGMYEFYKTRGGLSKKQLQALLKTIESIRTTPPFNPATIEAMIKKKAAKSKAPLPVNTPVYKQDTETAEKISAILQIVPVHKAALMYKNKLDNNEPLTQADKDSINKFLQLLEKKK